MHDAREIYRIQIYYEENKVVEILLRFSLVCLHIIPDQSCCFKGTVDCSIEFVACLEDIRNISYTVEFESIFLTCNAYN